MNIRTFLPALAATSLLSGFAAAQAPVATDTTTTTVTATPLKPIPSDREVGISAREGISLSGKDVVVTRNGVSEILSRELTLPNGIRVFPDGTAIMPDAGKITLRAEQILTFEGKLTDLTPAPTKTTTTTVVPENVTPKISAPPITPALEEAARAAAAAEAQRRAAAGQQ